MVTPKWVCALLAPCLGAWPLRAQKLDLDVGARIRIQVLDRPGRVDGFVISASPESLTVALRAHPGRLVHIAVPRIRTVSWWAGRTSHWRQGAEWGAFAGFVLVSASFVMGQRRCVGLGCRRGSEWLAWGGVGALTGAAVGGVVGGFITSDVWRPTPVQHRRTALAGTGRLVVKIPL